jgi:hypothetical protein
VKDAVISVASEAIERIREAASGLDERIAEIIEQEVADTLDRKD